MDNRKLVKLVRREIRALLRLSPWVLASLLVAALVWRTDLVAVSGLFQSPPAATDTVEPASPTPTEEPTLVPTETDTPTDEPPTPTSTVTPTSTLTSTPTPEPTPVLIESPIPESTGESRPGEETPVSSATDEPGRYAEDEADLEYDWGMLFDSVALGVSYLWLCCGVVLLVAVPAFFFVLWVMSRRRRQAQEE